MLEVDEAMIAARAAKEHGATRFFMGAPWQTPRQMGARVLSATIKVRLFLNFRSLSS